MMHPQPKAVQASRSSAHITTRAYDEGKEWVRSIWPKASQGNILGTCGLGCGRSDGNTQHKIKHCKLSTGVYNYPCKFSYEQWQGRLSCLAKGPCKKIYIYMFSNISYTYGHVDLHHKCKSKKHNSKKQRQLVNQRKHKEQKQSWKFQSFDTSQEWSHRQGTRSHQWPQTPQRTLHGSRSRAA